MIVDGKRALAYTVTVDAIDEIAGADNIALATVGGWKVIVKKEEFKPGDVAVFFEIDSKLPEEERYAFMERKHYKVKTMKLGKFGVVSQGLLMPLSEFPELANDLSGDDACRFGAGIDLTDTLHITYAEAEDNKRKSTSNKDAKYQSMAARHKNIFRQKWARWFMRREWGRKLMFAIFGKKRDNPREWPVGKFPGVSKTDQERCENLPWIIEDKSPWIRTQKCDGSSATYILARKKRKYEFYVCSRNVRMADEKQECFYGSDNYYWEMAFKYDIQNKMKEYLTIHPELTFVCWQGEICGPNIQKNPQNLSERHLFCFHFTDDEGRKDIRDAKEIWDAFDMEAVPIEYILYTMPDDFEEFKLSADGCYDASCCEGHTDCAREGYVYYSVADPTRSFKNVSRTYLLKHNG